jgi:hypothetical protein
MCVLITHWTNLHQKTLQAGTQPMDSSVQQPQFLAPISFYSPKALVRLDLLFDEVAKPQSGTQHSVELLWTNDRAVAETDN